MLTATSLRPMASLAKSAEVAALFVSFKSIYHTLPSVDCWTISRDALLYRGDAPIVAHPPCSRWSMLSYSVAAQGGKPVGADGGVFEFALDTLFRCGGVLEHPEHSGAWGAFGLSMPLGDGWTRATRDGARYWVCRIFQGAYGFPSRKPTWLLYVGTRKPFELDWSKPDERGQMPSGLRASATPPRLARTLVRLARHSRQRKKGKVCLTE